MNISATQQNMCPYCQYIKHNNQTYYLKCIECIEQFCPDTKCPLNHPDLGFISNSKAIMYNEYLDPKETINLEFKAFTFNSIPKNKDNVIYRHFISSINDYIKEVDLDFNNLYSNIYRYMIKNIPNDLIFLIIEIIEADLLKYIPKYMSCFYNSSKIDRSPQLIYGISEELMGHYKQHSYVTGFPFPKHVNPTNIKSFINHVSNLAIDNFVKPIIVPLSNGKECLNRYQSDSEIIINSKLIKVDNNADYMKDLNRLFKFNFSIVPINHRSHSANYKKYEDKFYVYCTVYKKYKSVERNFVKISKYFAIITNKNSTVKNKYKNNNLLTFLTSNEWDMGPLSHDPYNLRYVSYKRGMVNRHGKIFREIFNDYSSPIAELYHKYLLKIEPLYYEIKKKYLTYDDYLATEHPEYVEIDREHSSHFRTSSRTQKDFILTYLRTRNANFIYPEEWRTSELRKKYINYDYYLFFEYDMIFDRNNNPMKQIVVTFEDILAYNLDLICRSYFHQDFNFYLVRFNFPTRQQKENCVSVAWNDINVPNIYKSMFLNVHSKKQDLWKVHSRDLKTDGEPECTLVDI